MDTHSTSVHRRVCPWCACWFTPRHTGGKPQLYCSLSCRRAKERALRQWAQEQMHSGKVAIPDLKRVLVRLEVTGHGLPGS